jgi:methyltransferase-like protein/predicted O-methyltransferase YrrM
MPTMPETPPPAVVDTVNTYDAVPYDSFPFVQTHPDRMATIATLFGLKPPAVETCRVLELGCAGGGNLLPMAEQIPNGTLLGIDMSPRQIDDGQKIIAAAGLTNVELRKASILDVGPDFGEFDYIIAHGVFSWVPAAVQDKIFEICAANLAPDGIAYVSYNTYPGWHMRGMIRDMMTYHASRFDTPVKKTRQARALLDFLVHSLHAQDRSAYAVMLKQELESIRGQADHYLYHEHLEVVNEPIYFHRFAERARDKGLQFMGEARIGTMVTANFGPEVDRTLRTVAQDLIQMEQYMDFLRNRQFRESLLVKEGTTVNYTIYPEVLRKLYVSSPSRPAQEPIDIRSTEPVPYRSPTGATLSTSVPLVKAAMQHLREVFPRAVPFDQVHQAAREKLAMPAAAPAALNQERHLIGVGLLNCYTASDLVGLHAYAPPLEPEVRDMPVASPVARELAKTVGLVPNRRHELVKITDIERHILPRLDGTRGRMKVVEELTELVTDRKLVIKEGESVVTEPQKLRLALTTLLDQSLNALARQALIVG